jgi:hypothetical protein
MPALLAHRVGHRQPAWMIAGEVATERSAAMSDSAMSTEPKVDIEEQRRRQMEFSRPAIALLQSWLEDENETVEEQREALFTLIRAIDEDRGPDSKLFQHFVQAPHESLVFLGC